MNASEKAFQSASEPVRPRIARPGRYSGMAGGRVEAGGPVPPVCPYRPRSRRKLVPGSCLVPILILAGCDRPPELVAVAQSWPVMGTQASVTAVARNRAIATASIDAAHARLDDVNRRMSDYRGDSEIGRLNSTAAGRALAVSPETFHVLRQAMAVSEACGGAFDVTCRPIVQLWKEAGRQDSLPDRDAIARTLARVGWEKVKLDSTTRSVTLTVDGMQIDVGAIAKGYGLDLAAEAMRKSGAMSCLIEVGGDVLAVGTSETGKPWRIGIQHPFQEGVFGYLSLTDRAVATSGDRLRFIVIDGKRYSHIVDPRTGRPAEQSPSVTVIAPTGLTADAWATAFSVLSVDEGRRLATTLQDVEALWIGGSPDDIRIAKTPGFDRYLPTALPATTKR